MAVNVNEPPKLTVWELAAIRAQEYPEIIDDNGQPWYMNKIRSLETEIERLRAELNKR